MARVLEDQSHMHASARMRCMHDPDVGRSTSFTPVQRSAQVPVLLSRWHAGDLQHSMQVLLNALTSRSALGLVSPCCCCAVAIAGRCIALVSLCQAPQHLLLQPGMRWLGHGGEEQSDGKRCHSQTPLASSTTVGLHHLHHHLWTDCYAWKTGRSGRQRSEHDGVERML